jgi:NAD dependent epimerase/dehydratase family enzyme
MASQVDTYRDRAAEYERIAETLGQSDAAIRDYYGNLARHWRSMALLAEYATMRTTEAKISAFLWGAGAGAIAALSAILIFLSLRA